MSIAAQIPRSGRGAFVNRSVSSRPQSQRAASQRPPTLTSLARRRSKSAKTAGAGSFERLEPRLLMSYSQSMPTLSLYGPGATTGDHYGRALTTLGSSLIIASPWHTQGTRTSDGVVYQTDQSGNVQVTDWKSAGGNGEYLGYAVAAGPNNTLVVGASNTSVGAASSGSAYLFNQSTGTIQTNFTPSNPGNGWGFGTSIACQGNYVLIGAQCDGTFASKSGAAYLYDTSGNLLCKYYPPAATAGQYFGISVGFLANGNVAIGCRGDNFGSATLAGSVYIMSGTATGTCRTAVLKIQKAVPASNDAFGYSIATSGNQVLVGAVGDNWNKGTAPDGAAYLFDGTTGQQLEMLTDPYATASEQFGYSVALGDYGQALVGVESKTGVGGQGGAGEVLEYSVASGQMTHQFLNPQPVTNDVFGSVVAFDGNNVLIGAPGKTVSGLSNEGAAYLYTPTDAAPVANAGSTQSVADNTVVTLTGAKSTDPDGSDDIISYAWDLTGGSNFTTVGQSIQFTESAPGTYPVSLQVTDRAGKTSTSTVNITFSDTPPVVSAGSNQNVAEGSALTLAATASSPDGAGIVTYAWDYNYVAGQTFVSSASGQSVNTAYSTPGTYTAAVQVTDQFGLINLATTTITVTDVAPTPALTGPAAAAVGSPVSFTGSFTDPGTTAGDTVAWNFGDGGTIAAQPASNPNALTPTYTFVAAGTYTVTFTVQDAFGGISSTTEQIVIS
jgi:PKD repeat protein